MYVLVYNRFTMISNYCSNCLFTLYIFYNRAVALSGTATDVDGRDAYQPAHDMFDPSLGIIK